MFWKTCRCKKDLLRQLKRPNTVYDQLRVSKLNSSVQSVDSKATQKQGGKVLHYIAASAEFKVFLNNF